MRPTRRPRRLLKLLAWLVLASLLFGLAFWAGSLNLLPTLGSWINDVGAKLPSWLSSSSLDSNPGPSPDSSAPPPPADQLSLVAVGDVVLARKVAKAMAEYGVDYPFMLIGQQLRDADLTFGNLECPISDRGSRLPGKGIWFRADPAVGPVLKDVGFDVLSIANNHSLDYLDQAFYDTIDLVKAQGISLVGGGCNLAEARQPVIREVNGIRIAFLAYSDMADIYWSQKFKRTLAATEDRCGVAPLKIDMIEEDVSKAVYASDLVVVSLHWGVEYSDYPTAEQRRLAHRIIDAGARLVLGHHPHTLQGVEYYKGGLIAYSLGNFVLDQYQKQKTQESFLLKVKFRDHGKTWKAEIWPVVLPKSQPRLATGPDADRILEKTRRLSQKLGTNLTLSGDHLTVESQTGIGM
ncbi:MAG: CapA family protein [Clostridia bacterium]|nr:CapA family protein [Clostridia bacterium]